MILNLISIIEVIIFISSGLIDINIFLFVIIIGVIVVIFLLILLSF